MFIPIEGEDCIFLEDVIALVHDEGKTTVYYGSGRTSVTGFRPITLKNRLRELMKGALRPRDFLSQQEGKHL